MSSEHTIHLGDKSIKGRVIHFGEPKAFATVRFRIDDPIGGNPENSERTILFVKESRLLEVSLLFHKIAQDLAALLPNVDACCHCVPGTPDDQCAKHGFEAWLQGRVDADGDTIPIEDAAEAVELPHRWG